MLKGIVMSESILPPLEVALTEGRPQTVDEWVRGIRLRQRRTVAAVVDLGKYLIKCKAALAHGQWTQALELAEISLRVAEMFMTIASDPVLANPSNHSALPLAYNTLYDLSKLQAETLEDGITTGWVNPSLTQKALKEKLGGPTKPRLNEWRTPPSVIETVREFFGGTIDLDPCSNSHDKPSVPAHLYFTAADNGLTKEWRGKVFVNPPIADRITQAWVGKAKVEWRNGHVDEIILLLPAVTWSNWFHVLLRESPACFLQGRLHESGIPLVLFYLGERREEFTDAFDHLGTVAEAKRIRVDPPGSVTGIMAESLNHADQLTLHQPDALE
jgi:hypothetical protein